MNLSRYILKYSTDDGTLYFNTKTNHSFFLTNELNRVVDGNDVIRKEFHAYLDKNKYLSEGEYEVEKYLCKSVKEKIRKNLALIALSKSYNDILDVD